MVWQRFAKSPRIACAGSTPVASAKLSEPPAVAGGQYWTCSSGESERDSAKVEVARSNRARSTSQKVSYGVAELERRESLKLVCVGSNPTSVASSIV